MTKKVKIYQHGNCTGSWKKIGPNIIMCTYSQLSEKGHTLTVLARQNPLNAFVRRQQEGLRKHLKPNLEGNMDYRSELQLCFQMAIDARKYIADLKKSSGYRHTHNNRKTLRTNRSAIAQRVTNGI